MSWKIFADVRETFVEVSAKSPQGDSLFIRTLNRKDQMHLGLKEALTFLPEDFVPAAASVEIRSDYAKTLWRENWLPPMALLTTEGFQNILEISYQNRSNLFSLKSKKSPAPIPIEHCFGVTERTTKEGRVEMAPQPAELETIFSKLDLMKINSVAISFLHSPKNPQNEITTTQYFKEKGFRVFPSFSEKGFELERTLHLIQTLVKEMAEITYVTELEALGFKKENITYKESLNDKKTITVVEDRIFSNETGMELPLSPMSPLFISSTGVPQIKYENVGSEPGPVCFGKGVNLTLFDLLVLKNGIQFDEIKKLKIDHARVKKYLLLLSQQLRLPWESALDKYLEMGKSLILIEAENIFGAKQEYDGWMAPYFFKNTVKPTSTYTKEIGQVTHV